MNSRRSFFKSLALLGAGAVTAPGIFIPKFEPVRWKPLLKQMVVRNRDYSTAQFEVYLSVLGDCPLPYAMNGNDQIWGVEYPVAKSHRISIRRTCSAPIFKENWVPYPVRGNKFTKDGKLIPIPPFISLWIKE